MSRAFLPTDPVDDSISAQAGTDGYDPADSATGRPDWTFRILVTALLAVAVWLLAMPWVPAIARCTMQRFHLRTGSYAAWAIQQPIPPMYSFANTTQVRSLPAKQLTDSIRMTDDRSSSSAEFPIDVSSRTINHFPTREFTFANARIRFLQDRSSKWFVLQSTYRGQTVKSVYYLDPAADGSWTVTLIEGNDLLEENES